MNKFLKFGVTVFCAAALIQQLSVAHAQEEVPGEGAGSQDPFEATKCDFSSSEELTLAKLCTLKANYFESQLSFSPVRNMGFEANGGYFFFVRDNKETQITPEFDTENTSNESAEPYNGAKWEVSGVVGPLEVSYRSIDYTAEEVERIGIANMRLQIPLLMLDRFTLGVGGVFTGFILPDKLLNSAAFGGTDGKAFKEGSKSDFLNKVDDKLAGTDWGKKFIAKNPFKRYSFAITADASFTAPLWKSFGTNLELVGELNYAYTFGYLPLEHGLRGALGLKFNFVGIDSSPDFTLQGDVFFVSTAERVYDAAKDVYNKTKEAIKEKKASVLFSKAFAQELVGEYFDLLGLNVMFGVSSGDKFKFHFGYRLAYYPAATLDGNMFNFEHGVLGYFNIAF